MFIIAHDREVGRQTRLVKELSPLPASKEIANCEQFRIILHSCSFQVRCLADVSKSLVPPNHVKNSRHLYNVFFNRCSESFSRFYGQNSALSTVFSSQIPIAAFPAFTLDALFADIYNLYGRIFKRYDRDIYC